MMLTNKQMIAGRYLRWHRARRAIAAIRAHLQSGGLVVISTYTRAWKCDARHLDLFEASRNGAWMRHGSQRSCIDGCAIKFYRARKVA